MSQANEEEGMPGIVAPLVIWLLAFSFAGLWNVIYACYLLSSKGTWGRYMSTSGRDIVDHSVRVSRSAGVGSAKEYDGRAGGRGGEGVAGICAAIF